MVGVSDDFHQGSASWASPEVPMAKYGWYCDGRRGSLGVIVRERAAR